MKRFSLPMVPEWMILVLAWFVACLLYWEVVTLPPMPAAYRRDKLGNVIPYVPDEVKP